MFKIKKKEKKLHPYKMGIFSFVPVPLKIFFVKWWFIGMAYFFLGFGGTLFAPGSYESLFSLGAVIGLLNAYMVTPVIRDLSRLECSRNPFLSVRRQGRTGTLTHICLSVLIVILVSFTYDFVNRMLIAFFSLDSNRVHLQAEPIGFALIYLGYDFLWRKLTFRIKEHDDIKKSVIESAADEGSIRQENKGV